MTEGTGEKPPKLKPKEEVEFPFPAAGKLANGFKQVGSAITNLVKPI